MKYTSLICGFLLALTTCSTNNDVAVTQTGNPTKVMLLIKADTARTPMSPLLQKRMGASIMINRAYLVVYRVEIETADEAEFILFKGPNPYIIELLPGGGTGMVDSAHAIGNNSYESIEMEIGPLSDTLLTPMVPDSLKRQSVFVEGYFGTDSLNAFTFTSGISEELEYPLDSTLVLPSANDAEILVKFRVYDWFRDSLGAFIDPQDPGNRATIEKNITSSVEVEEETDNEELEENE